MKKALSLILALAMIVTVALSVVGLQASAKVDANTDIAFSMTSPSGKVGDTVQVDVNLSADSHLVNMDLYIHFPSTKLELQKAYTQGDQAVYAVTDTTVLPGMAACNLTKEGTFRLAYASSAKTDVGGKMFTLQFKILADDVSSVDLQLTADPIGANWQNEQDPALDYVPKYTVSGGKISIVGASETTTTSYAKDSVVNMLDGTRAIVSGNGSIEARDGKLVVKANDGDGVTATLTLNRAFGVEDNPYLLFNVDSAVPYDMQFTVATNNGFGMPGLISDFYPEMNYAAEDLVNGYLPATQGNQSFAITFKGYFTWNKLTPSNGISNIQTVTIKLAAAGTFTLEALQFKDQPPAVILPLPDATTSTTTQAYDKGDVNRDHRIDSKDSLLLYQFVSGTQTLTPEQQELGDLVAPFGTVNMQDALRLFQYVSGTVSDL